MPFLPRPSFGRRTKFIYTPLIGIGASTISAIFSEPSSPPPASSLGSLAPPIRPPRPPAGTIPPVIGPPSKPLIKPPDDHSE